MKVNPYRKFPALLFAVLIILAGAPTVHAQDVVTIDPATKYQYWHGWGTSLSWGSTVIGGWSDKNRNAIADLIFDPQTGLGLNIARYHIGGHDAPGHDHMRFGGDVPGYKLSEDAPYDWSQDENQRNMLQAAMDRGVNIVEAFNCSAPYWMTESGCTAGGEDAANNLKEDYYEAFADYLTDVVKHFRDEWGVTFNTLEPVNEAATAFWKKGGNQQGCHFDPEKQSKLLKIVAQKLNEKGLTTQLSGPDETSLHHTMETFLAYDEDVKNLVKQINTHTYRGNNKEREALRKLATEHGKRLYMSEICYNSAVEGEEDPVKGALDIARSITRDLRHLKPDAWVFWQPTVNDYWRRETGIEYGLIHADYEGDSEAWTMRKKYYGFLQYTHFIRPGDTMVASDAKDIVTFVNEREGTLVIVTYNDSKELRTRTYRLESLNRLGSSVAVYRTSQSQAMEKLGSLVGVKDGKFTTSEPGESVTTYVVEGLNVAAQETYQGREPDAPWRAKAEKRIEKHRKGDLKIKVLDTLGRPVKRARVEIKQKKHAFWFGNEIRGRLVVGDQEYVKAFGTTTQDQERYRETMASTFNVATFGNDLVWWYWINGGKETSVQVCEDFLKPTGLALRGIPLVWSGNHAWKNPVGVMEMSGPDLKKRLDAHITEMMQTLDGIPVMWDVLNEPISEPHFVELLGREEAVNWFKLARELEPQAELYCNDYGLLVDREKLNEFIELVQYLIDHGAPIDGVSPQGHIWQANALPSMDSLQESFDLLGKLGLKIYPDQFQIMRWDEQLQADYVRDFYTLAFSQPNVAGITYWGFWEGDIWMKESAWFRKDWTLKPVGKVMMDLLHKQWWTEVQGQTNRRGRFQTRAFLGDYEVTVSSGGQKGTVQLQLSKSGREVLITLPQGQ